MLEKSNWSSPVRWTGQVPLRRVIFFALLGVTILWCRLSPEPTSLTDLLKRIGDTQIADPRSGGGTQLESRPSLPIWDEAEKDSLRWRIQNQTRINGQRGRKPVHTGWHPRIIDTSEFTQIEPLQPGRLELVRHPHFREKPVLLKIADAHEAMIYRRLYDLGITPSFLGHVTQSGEVIGFITEFVQRQEQSPEPGSLSRREACLAALRRMHARGIAHRDAHGENCLLRDDGSAALIDFELSTETSSRADFERDLWIMYHTVLD